MTNHNEHNKSAELSRINQIKNILKDKQNLYKSQLDVLENKHNQQAEFNRIQKQALVNAQNNDFQKLKDSFKDEVHQLKVDCLKNCPVDASIAKTACETFCKNNNSI